MQHMIICKQKRQTPQREIQKSFNFYTKSQHRDHTFRFSDEPTAICLSKLGFGTDPFGDPAREEGRGCKLSNGDDEQAEKRDGFSFLQENKATRLDSARVSGEKASLAESTRPSRGTNGEGFKVNLKGVGDEEYRSLSMASLVSLSLPLSACEEVQS